MQRPILKAVIPKCDHKMAAKESGSQDKAVTVLRAPTHFQTPGLPALGHGGLSFLPELP